MTDVLLATTAADASAATAIEQHHAEMAGALAARVTALVTAAAGTDVAAQRAAQDSLVRWGREELLPHAAAEEGTLYPAARADERARLLIDAMLTEHGEITALVDELAAAPDAVRAATAGRALQAMFDSHLRKENELILPVLTSAADVSLAELLGGMHELLGGHDSHDGETTPAHGGPAPAAHNCGCGGHDEPGYPELDARVVPHAIRHATVFGALDAVPAGGGMVLIAPHDPLPLLAQIEARFPGVFEVGYLERGPEAWRLAFVRSA
jgi:uncharacterized protein (DUF2249 family)